MAERTSPPGLAKRARIIMLAAGLLSASLFSLAAILQENRWEVARVFGGGTEASWFAETSRFYTTDFDTMTQYRRSGDKLENLGGVYVQRYDRLSPVGYHRGWLMVEDEGQLLAFPVGDFPSDGALHNYSAVTHRGPVSLYYALSSPSTDWDVLHFGEFGPTVLIGAMISHDASRIVALDMPDPSAVSEDPHAFRVLYNLTFDGWMYDMKVDGSTLYVLAGNLTSESAHVIDLGSNPPTERFSFPLEAAISLDVEKNIVAVTTSEGLTLYAISASSATRLSWVAIPGQTESVRFVSSRVYVSWDREGDRGRQVGLAILDVSDPSSPQVLWNLDLNIIRYTFATKFAVGNNTVYFPGNGNVAMVFLATRPALLMDVPLQIAIVVSAGLAVTGVVYARVRRRQLQRPAEKQVDVRFPP